MVPEKKEVVLSSDYYFHVDPIFPKNNKPTVVMKKFGNILELSNFGNQAVQPEILSIIKDHLTYNKLEFNYGKKKSVRSIPKQLYRLDSVGRCVCGFGFYKKICDLLENNGFGVYFVNSDLPVHRRQRPLCYKSDWSNVENKFNFYPRQRECLEQIAKNPCGVVHAVTGFGKMVLIAMVCALFPFAKIDIVTRRRDLVKKLKSFLSKWIPNVGQVGAGSLDIQNVTVYTASSLHHSDFSADFLLADEGHELMSDETSKWLVKYRNTRNFLFTASPTGRSDNTDMRMESLFGPIIFYISYPEAVDLGLVVPIKVEWSDVLLPSNPCLGFDGVVKERRGIWQNEARNEIIARKARSFGDQDQVQIFVKTVEHAIYLKKHLPEFTLVYDTLELSDRNKYIRRGVLSSDEPLMTPERRDQLRQAFERGDLTKVISTNVWSTGIDARKLTALIRADAMSSEIVDIQAPGRVSRKFDSEEKVKNFGIVCDFWDQFDPGFFSKAKRRHKHYQKMGWEQETINV
jgi:superfamily II DNA or RNA helicase